MKDFDKIYKNKTNQQLVNSKITLTGQLGTGMANVEDRLVSINRELHERGIKMEEEKARLPISHEDYEIAERYISKRDSSVSRNIDFELSFSEYKRIVSRKTCYYTGIKLTVDNPAKPTHLTIDRIDSTKGYVKGNCVACANYVNATKNALLENPRSEMLFTVKQLKRMAEKL